MASEVKIGLCIWSMQSFQLNEQTAEAYEQLGMDSGWVIDHFLGLVSPELWPELPASAAFDEPEAFLDPFCVASVLAGKTSLELGSNIVDVSRRRAIDIARSVLTVHNHHPKGFILGAGCGIKLNLEPYGYELNKRVSRYEECLRELRSLLDTGRMPDGGVGRIGLPLESAAGRPQVWGAAHAPRMRRIVGTYADGWITSGASPEQFAVTRDDVLAHAEAAGRPQPTCAFSPLVIVGESRDAVAAAIEEVPLANLIMLFAPASTWQRYDLEHPGGPDAQGYADALPHAMDQDLLREVARKVPFEMLEELVLCGSGEEIAARLRPYADAGAEHMILCDATGLCMAPEKTEAVMPEYAKIKPALNAVALS
jgi:phthiodiolone/phenolphthiodiolone dimycocerosates ketoreductase